jgi:hypothetical protein
MSKAGNWLLKHLATPIFKGIWVAASAILVPLMTDCQTTHHVMSCGLGGLALSYIAEHLHTKN